MTHVVVTDQSIALGPVASQEAIKMLGTNGGGFFNANSAHPYENPTPLTDLLELLAILWIPAALCLHLRDHGEGHEAGLGHLGSPCSSCWRPCFTFASNRNNREIPYSINSRREPMGRPSPTVIWKARKCGSASRVLPLGLGDDRRLQRVRQLHARFFYAPGGNGSHVDDHAGGSFLRRGRFGPLRHAGFRHPGGFRGGTHGGPHPRIPGKKIQPTR